MVNTVLLIWVCAFELQTRDAPPNIDQASSWCFKPCFLCFFLVTVPVNRFVFLRLQGRIQNWWISSVQLFDSFGVWVCYGLGLVRLLPFAVESCGLSPWVLIFICFLCITAWSNNQFWPNMARDLLGCSLTKQKWYPQQDPPTVPNGFIHHPQPRPLGYAPAFSLGPSGLGFSPCLALSYFVSKSASRI